MTFKRVFYAALFLSACIIALSISFNVYQNEYGLFGDARGKSISIVDDERKTKYLLSYNYIPANFEGILVGPSVSDNLDTKKLSEYRIYNASLRGGNISELKYIAENVIRRGNLKFIIVCLYPYLTKNHGRKTSSIDPREFRGTLGSRDTLKFYSKKLKMNSPSKNYNDYGCNFFHLKKQKQRPSREGGTRTDADPNTIRSGTGSVDTRPEPIDEVAYRELASLLDLARSRKIQIFAFYYPYFLERFNEPRFNSYKSRIDKLFTPRDLVWNFNEDRYLAFRSDPDHYFDGAHLSGSGADGLIHEIKRKLDAFYRPASNGDI